MTNTVLVVGAGQLGSRYLQGLVNAKSQLEITVVDPSVSSLATAKARWREAGGERCHHQISWTHDLSDGLGMINLALVVTSAKGRAALIEKITAGMYVDYWVVEKVLAQSAEEIERIMRATSRSRAVWVNTPRRMMGWHQCLKNAVEDKGPIAASYSGDRWGLACNSIHFIDLIAWWMDEKLESVNLSGLGSDWFESKRVGYFDVTGKLVAHFSKGSTLTLESRDQAHIQPLRIDLADGTTWNLDEVNGTAFTTAGDYIDGNLEFQSQLSGRLIDDIRFQGQCNLPTLKESASMHSIFLKAMLKHWNHSQKRNDICVPIT